MQSSKDSPMSKILSRARPALRLLAVLGSVALLGYLVWHAGPAALWQNLIRLGWAFTAVIALAGISHFVRTWAWQLTLGAERHKISFPKLVGLRLGAEAAGQLGILGQTFGDSFRVSHLNRLIQTTCCLASVTLDRGLYLVTGMIVTVGGLLAALPLLSHSHALHFYAGLLIVGSVAFLLFALVAMRKRSPLLSEGARLVGRIPPLKTWIEQRLNSIESLENALFDFHHVTPGLFWCSFALNLAAHCLAISEVCLVLWLLGTHIGVVGALVIEALTKLVNAVGSLNPGNIGTYETGNMLIVKIFGVTNATGLALAMTRRLRALFWTAVGCISLVLLTRSRRFEDIGGINKEEPLSPPETSANVPAGPLSRGVTFVIFLSDRDARQPLAKVGSLPIPLRSILAAQRLDPSEILVIADPKRILAQELLRTRRLAPSVRWIDVEPETSFQEQVRRAADEVRSQRVVLVDGSAAYHPSVIQQVNEWSSDSATLALTSGGLPIGLHALSTDELLTIPRDCAARNLDRLLASISYSPPVVSIKVSDLLWQRVRSEKDRQIAERKLDSWLVKPTDGMYARLNRRISIPISRQLIRFPITANMVSIFTLAVGIVSAVFFALGGYWNTVLGALLCLFSSILDGCDGEVARLKLLESDFGCWLETICDYIFYFLLLIGMTVGQWRTGGSKSYLLWGGVLLFGSLASFLALGWQRRRLATGRPEQLLGIWQGHVEKRSSNPLLYAARHLEFIVRRCFFPYALVAFALLDIMNVAFLLSVIGANLVWPVALYSARAFAGGPAATVTSRTVSAET
jgi:phosphatidylglycerophosphate synthase